VWNFDGVSIASRLEDGELRVHDVPRVAIDFGATYKDGGLFGGYSEPMLNFGTAAGTSSDPQLQRRGRFSHTLADEQFRNSDSLFWTQWYSLYMVVKAIKGTISYRDNLTIFFSKMCF
jgi:hypothetical protein